VTVVPETAEVPAGGSFSFRANIRGSGNVGGVTWSLGKIYQNTSIDPDTGVLTVGENEIIGTELKIIATSKVDGTKVGTAKVTVVQKKHRVEFRAASAGGIITAIDGNGNPLRNNSQVEHKTTVTFTATPNAEYTVGEWTYNGEVQNETPDENVELSEDLTKLTLTVTTGSAITVKFDGGPGADYGDYKVTVISGGTYPSGDERYDEGDTVEIYADTPPEGQEFSEWTVVEPEDWVLPENSLNTSPTTFTMPGHDVTVRAVFKGSGETPSPTPGGTTPTPTPGGTPTPTGGVNRWQLTVRAESNGRILYDVSGMYAPGARVTITAVPNTGYSFLRWASTNGGAFSNLYSPTTTFTMPNNATTVIAYFTDGDGVYYTEPSYNDASLSSSRLTYDKNGGGNINVRLNAKGYSLLSVTDGVFELEKDHDYILSGNSITLAREFLAGLPLGENTIVFNMSEGADPVLVIDVRDTSRDVLPAVIAVDPTPVSAPENTAGETPPDDATASDVPGEPLPVPVPTPKPTVDVPAPNPADYPALELRVNDIPLAFTGQPPIFKDNTVLIPLREVFENLGYAYEWDAVSATATLTRKNTVITVTEKSYFFEVNGTPYRYGSAYAQTVGGALMVPLSEILKSAGGTVYNDRNSVIRVQILK
jgi:hypothetical protein